MRHVDLTAGDGSQFADLIDQIADRLAAAEAVDIESVVGQHPALAEPLRAAYDSLVGLYAAADAPAEGDDVQPRRLGDFKLLGELGRGGMGIVYEAEQISLGRRVALKVLPLAGLLDRRQLARFKNEARAAAMLKHPNIVSVYSVGNERGVHYYAMELIDGSSLAEIIAEITAPALTAPTNSTDSAPSQETVPIAAFATLRMNRRREYFRSVARLGEQAADAIHYAHQEGVIHRDIKPSNVMVEADGNVQITDFGLARIHSGDEVTITGDIVGTLRYMSPEQLDETAVADQRTDIYSLGLTLYELVTGHAAFDAARGQQLLLQLQHSEPLPPSKHDSQIPRDLENILLKAMARRPEDRYASAGALGDDLRCFLAGAPVAARRISALTRSWRWCLRNRSKAALLTLIGLLLLTLAIGGPLAAWQQAQQTRQQSQLAERRGHELYDADMAQAHGHIAIGEVDQATAILRRHAPSADGEADYRSFEWYEMVERCRRHLEATTIDMNYPVWSVAAAPNGDVAVGAYNHSPVVFDSVTGAKQWEPRGEDGHDAVAAAMNYTADGRFLITSSQDLTFKVWAATDGRLLHTETLSQRPDGIAVSTTGLVAVGLWGELGKSIPHDAPAPILLYQLAAAEDGKSVKLTEQGQLDGAVGAVRGIAFSPDGQLVAGSSDDHSLRIWDTDSKQIVRNFDDHHGPVMHVAWSADGKRLCGGGGVFDGEWQAGEAIIWDVESGVQHAVLHHQKVVYEVRFTPDGSLVTLQIDGQLKLWDADNGDLLQQIHGHAETTRGIAVFPSGSRIASASDDGTVRIWDVARAAPRSVLTDPDILEFIDLAFSPDGKQLASASADKAIRVWDVDSGALISNLGSHAHWAYGVAYSRDGKLLASCAAEWPNRREAISELKLWSVKKGTLLGTYAIDVPYARSLEFGSDGKRLVLGTKTSSSDGQIILWNVQQRAEEKRLNVKGGFHVVVSRDGRLIGTTSGLWKYPSLEPVCAWPTEGAGYAIDIGPHGDVVAVAAVADHTIVIRSAEDGSIVQELHGHHDIVLTLDFSPDGRRLASAGISGVIILWDLETGNEILRYRDHASWVWQAEFSPDGNVLASCDSGGLLRPKIRIRRAMNRGDALRILGRER